MKDANTLNVVGNATFNLTFATGVIGGGESSINGTGTIIVSFNNPYIINESII